MYIYKSSAVVHRALCYLSVKQYQDAVKDCEQALRMDQVNIKALYRRALAHKELKVSLLHAIPQLIQQRAPHTRHHLSALMSVLTSTSVDYDIPGGAVPAEPQSLRGRPERSAPD